MDFADILDNIARPAPADESAFRRGKTHAFWQVLDQIADAPPVSDDRLKEAYFSDGFLAAPLGPEEPEPPEISLDPEDIADELDLAAVSSLDELSTLRRRFAMLNHPDRMPPAFRDRANRRMTIANSMIDEAGAKLSR